MSKNPNVLTRTVFTAICAGGLAIAASALLPATASAQRLQRCADEGGTCRLPYPAEVVYGARGYTTSRFINRPAVRCANRVFGDPAPGLPKACYIVRRAGGYYGGGYGDNDYGPGGDSGGWTACANEGDFCDFYGRKVVRYGARGRYTEGVFRGGVQCDNDSFGDPAPGAHKRCYVRQ
ncbi:conserved exported hypothetical protein [Mesorhizobium sp. ORS 3324]|nr:conserved exported hypothetical protein [Mesorhizobium sp. ORS 3324]